MKGSRGGQWHGGTQRLPESLGALTCAASLPSPAARRAGLARWGGGGGGARHLERGLSARSRSSCRCGSWSDWPWRHGAEGTGLSYRTASPRGKRWSLLAVPEIPPFHTQLAISLRSHFPDKGKALLFHWGAFSPFWCRAQKVEEEGTAECRWVLWIPKAASPSVTEWGRLLPGWSTGLTPVLWQHSIDLVDVTAKYF